MLRYTAIRAVPIGLLFLCGCANNGPNTTATSSDNSTIKSERASNVVASTPGYVAFKAGDYATSNKDFKEANIKTPNNAFDELDLGATYQRLGRMDLAEPLFRRAMTHGHKLATAETTSEMSRGHTVEEIACQNLAIGLKPASIEGTATPCQTTLVVAVVAAPTSYSSSYQQTSYNTYFEFDKSSLTPDGLALIQSAAKDIRDNPARNITLVGKASSVGTDSYNMALSMRRADSVRDALLAAGVPPSKITTQWVGERQLPVAEAEGHKEPLNRVVEERIK